MSKSGRIELDHQAGLEAVPQPPGASVIAAGARSAVRTIWRRGCGVVEGVEELVGGARLVLEEMDVVDDQDVGAAIDALKASMLVGCAARS